MITPPIETDRRERPSDVLLDRFIKLYSLLLEKNNFFDRGPVETPRLGTDYVKELQKDILNGANFMSKSYRSAYIDPLCDKLEHIITTLENWQNESIGDFKLTVLVNAAVQPGVEGPVAKDIRSLRAVISDIFTSYLYTSRRRDLGLPLHDQKLPPLAAFVAPILNRPQLPHNLYPWPITMDLDQMRGLSPKFTVGAVGLPSGFRNHPILWGVLAHEIGGHDMLHADEQLLPDLKKGMRIMFDGQEKILGSLWRYWCEETASDVCGVLNIGPSFGLGVFVYYTVIAQIGARLTDEGQEHGVNGKWKPPFLPSVVLRRYGENYADMHPVPALIPDVIIGAVEQLNELSPTTRTRFVYQLEELAKKCIGDQTTVTFEAGAIITDDDGKDLALPNGLEYKLEDMRTWARKVGAYIANAVLPVLGNKSLKDIETWDSPDEKAAQRVANKLQTREPLDDDSADDAQLLAGGILTVFREPALYDDVNKDLRKAFERSFELDPYINVAKAPTPTA